MDGTGALATGVGATGGFTGGAGGGGVTGLFSAGWLSTARGGGGDRGGAAGVALRTGSRIVPHIPQNKKLLELTSPHFGQTTGVLRVLLGICVAAEVPSLAGLTLTIFPTRHYRAGLSYSAASRLVLGRLHFLVLPQAIATALQSRASRMTQTPSRV